MENNSKLTSTEQICIAIEQLAMGWNYFEKFPTKKFPLSNLISVFEEIYVQNEKKETTFIEKSYSNYRNRLFEEYKIKINFQRKEPKSFKKFYPTILKLLNVYLLKHSVNFSEKEVENYFKINQNQNQIEFGLYVIVFFQLSIRLGIQVEMEYEKFLETKKIMNYRIQPLAITCRGNVLQLIALDLKYKKKKHFVLSCIKKINTDIFKYSQDIHRKKSNFDIHNFIDSEEYKSNKKFVTYKISISKNKLKHFTNKSFPEFKLIEENSKSVIIEVQTHKLNFFFASIFQYKNDIKLLSPIESVEEYKKYLIDILKLYS